MNIARTLCCLFAPLLFLPSCRHATRPSMLTVEHIHSCALGEERACSIYLPEDFDPRRPYPVVYATDGQLLASEGYKAMLDSLIRERAIPSVVVVGVHSDETPVASDGGEMRYYEYVEGAAEETSDPALADRFRNHLTFFTREIRDSIRAGYSIRPEDGETIFYGCSNGGDYGMTLYATQPELFDAYICLSPVCTAADAIASAAFEAPVELYVAYGSREAQFPVIGDNLRALQEKLESSDNPRIAVRIYEGGHDRRMWKMEFATALVEHFRTPEE